MIQPYRPDPTSEQQAILDQMTAQLDPNFRYEFPEEVKSTKPYVVPTALVEEVWADAPHYQEFYLRLSKNTLAQPTPEQAESWRNSVKAGSKWSLRVAGRHVFDAFLALTLDHNLGRCRNSLSKARYNFRRAWVLCALWLKLTFTR